MKRHPKVIAILAAALLLPVGASGAEPAKPVAAAKPATTEKASKDERQCSMPTSPRLQKKGDDCEQATERTRSYSSDELKSTGRADSAEALRRLDPRVN